jgi:hypothetical protein
MKKIFYYLAVSAFLISCNNNESGMGNSSAEILSAENLRLIQEAKLKDSLMEEYFKTINEIEESLDLIKQNERLVDINLKDEAGRDGKNKIAEDIMVINELMLKYNAQVSQLEKQMKSNDFKSKEFEKLILRMELQLEEKNQNLSRMRAELLKLNNSFENLFSEYNERLNELDKQTGKINAAYFAIGTAKELKENNIIFKKSGVAGIGKTTGLMEDFNKSYFTKIDITETPSIELFGKEAKLLSNHPTNSYTIEKAAAGNEILKITKPEEFWSVSKYLVVIIQP